MTEDSRHPRPGNSSRSQSLGFGEGFRHGTFGLFVTCFLLSCARLVWPPIGISLGGAPEFLLLVLAALCSLSQLARELPWQNVLMAAALIEIVAAAIQWLLFGNSERFALLLLSWLVATLNGRQLAYQILQRRQGCSVFGLWLLGLTGFFVALFALGLSGWAAAQALRPDRAIWLYPASGGFIAVLGSAIATPWLIVKRPSRRPPGTQGTILWLLLNLWVATAAAGRTSWIAGLNVLIAAWVLITVTCRPHDKQPMTGKPATIAT